MMFSKCNFSTFGNKNIKRKKTKKIVAIDI